MSNCAAKCNLKKATDVDTSKFSKEVDSTSLKSDIDKLETDKLETTPTDLGKPCNVVQKDIVKKTAYDELVKRVHAIQTIDASDLVKLVTTTQYIYIYIYIYIQYDIYTLLKS